VDEVRAKVEILERHCADVGRNPDEIERTISFPIVIRDTADDAQEAYTSSLERNGTDNMGDVPIILGSPEVVAERLRPYVELGFRTVIVRLPSPYDPQTIERMSEVGELLADA
jgi:alkanesulfonate monooxygenase SsuD/methylene tetrahydromethanopterin reductase-like flavin-dependent oxidoreductase (luciferase family)